MTFYVLTLFPEMVFGGLNHSMIKRAMTDNAVSVRCVDIRDYAVNKHRRVDDYPYGGGAGMLLSPEPVYLAYKSLSLPQNIRVAYMTPQGKPFTQDMAREFANESELVLLCGHYEGVDERVIQEIVTDEVSLGDFVLTGGELAAMCIIDTVSRLIPGVLGNEASAENESFASPLLEYPQYTRPPVFLEQEVPPVLLSGNHQRVDEWRREQSILRTMLKRPDLYEKHKNCGGGDAGV